MRNYVRRIVGVGSFDIGGIGGEIESPLLAVGQYNNLQNPLFITLTFSVAGVFHHTEVLDDLTIPVAYYNVGVLSSIVRNSVLYRRLDDGVIDDTTLVDVLNNAGYKIPYLNAPAVAFVVTVTLFQLVFDSVQDVNIAQTWWGDLQDERVPVDINSASTIGLSSLQVYNHK